MLFDFLKRKKVEDTEKYKLSNRDTNSIHNIKKQPVNLEKIVDTIGEMKIDDVFTITGRGTVVTGTVSKGEFVINDNVQIYTSNGIIESTITGIEAFRKMLDIASEGMKVGILLRRIERSQINSGDIIIKKQST